MPLDSWASLSYVPLEEDLPQLLPIKDHLVLLRGRYHMRNWCVLVIINHVLIFFRAWVIVLLLLLLLFLFLFLFLFPFLFLFLFLFFFLLLLWPGLGRPELD
jgi:hypothetical protein